MKYHPALIDEKTFKTIQDETGILAKIKNAPEGWVDCGYGNPNCEVVEWPCSCNPCPSRMLTKVTINRVLMERIIVITDEKLIIDLWIGRCDKCKQVYWLKKPPPYGRVSRKFYEKVACSTPPK